MQAPQQPPPQQQLAMMISSYWVSAAIYVAAKLGIADLVHDAPQTIEGLAGRTGVHAPSLRRLLRALASVGVFAEGDDGRYRLTPLAEPLRKDAPASQWALAIMCGEEMFRTYGDLLDSVRTGGTAFDRVFGQPIFPFLQKHPEKAAVFDKAMVAIHGRETGAVLDAYDFSPVKTLADVGGGNGSVLIETLRRHAHLSGVLYDLPGVVDRATRDIAAAGLSGRCIAVGGDFFESVPGGADAYLLRHVIHDWDDEKAARILRNVRKAIPAGGRLLLVESVIPAGNEPCPAKLLDLTMLAMTGGLERTEDEYRKLLASVGFRLARVVPTRADVSVIEAAAV
jgi:SAM-dependent methyltransferase